MSGPAWGGKRTAASQTADWQLAGTANEPAEFDRIDRGVPSRMVPTRMVPLSVTMVSATPVSMAHAGEHDAERCRRA